MSNYTGNPSEEVTGGLSALVVKLRWLWVLMALAMLGFGISGASKLQLNPDARVFFDETNPDRIALDNFEADFSKDDNYIVMVSPKEGDVFQPEVLTVMAEMTERLWLLPHVRRVSSLTNFQHTYAVGDEMIVRDLVPFEGEITQQDGVEARDIALNREELVNALVSPDGKHAGMQVLFRLPGVDPINEVPSIVSETKALLAEFEAANPDIRFGETGSVLINNQFAVSGQQDGMTLTPAMFLVILLILFLALRSVFGSIMALAVIIVSVFTALGALGWSGLPLNSVTVLAPLIISILCVASVVHVLASVRQTMMHTPDRKEWARRALKEHGAEITIACLTTAIGFLALNFSITPPFRELGNIVAVGVVAAWILTLTLLPALITILPMKQRTSQASVDGLMRPLAEFVISWRKVLLVVMSLFVIALASGVPKLVLEDDFLAYFDERYEFRRDTDYYEQNLGALKLYEYSLPSGRAEGINDPQYLAQAQAFTEWLRAQPEVKYVRSLTDTLERLNENMHGDDPAMHKLPEDEASAAQFLFFYELSLGYGMDLTDQINVDRSRLRVSVGMTNVTTRDMLNFNDRAQAWFDENAPAIKTPPTGQMQVFNLISFRDVRAMLTGTVLALIAISGLLLLLLRDWKLGFMSLIPNLVPAAMAFGVWGYLVGQVTLAIAVVIAMTLGIVVDDTVHFLGKYKEGKRKGMSAEDAVRHAFDKVGMALCVTTLALVAGFAVLAQSGFAVNGDMAKLTALTITLALIADFLLLPALLIAIDKGKTSMLTSNATSTAAIFALALGAGVLTAGTAEAQSAEEKGLQIAIAGDASDIGWGDATSDGEMILRDTRGNETRRTWRGMNLEQSDPGKGDWSIIVFTQPRDIAGTATLTHSYLEPEDDDQWLYLPRIKKEKRITSSNRTGKFVGSEFSFEDLGAQEVADNTYKWLRDEPCPGAASQTCHVVESYPKNKRSGYSKRIAWSDTQEHRQYQVEFYNRRGDLEKVLTSSGYNQYAGKHWRPSSLVMENKQTGKSTELKFSNYQFGVGLDAGDFSAQRLSRLNR